MLLLAATTLQCQPVLIESVTGQSDPIPNIPNAPYYQELSGTWGGSGHKSKVPVSPPFDAIGSRQTSSDAGPPSFMFVVTNGYSLETGVKYIVQITVPTSPSQPPPDDLLVAVSASGLLQSWLVETTDVFSVTGVDRWSSLGEVICDSFHPTFTFTYVSGSLSSFPSRRFYVQCIRFVPQDQPYGVRTWTGGAGVSDPIWNNPTNWGGIAPRFTGDDLQFAGNQGAISIPDGQFSVNSLKFLPSARQFSIGSSNYNAYAGPISISSSNGIANLSSNDQTIYVPINQGGIPLIVDTGSRMLSISNALDGSAGYEVRGSGTLYLRATGNGTNPITGPILVTTGATLRVSRHGAVGATSAGAGDVTLDGSRYRNDDTTPQGDFLSPERSLIVGPSGAVLDVTSSSQNLVYRGLITSLSPSAPLVKTGGGRLTLAGDTPNDYMADTIVTDGRLILNKLFCEAIPSDLIITGGTAQLAASDQINDSAIVTVQAGRLGLSGWIAETVSQVILDGGSITGAVATLSASVFDFRSGTNSTMLAGNGNLLKTMPGTVLLSGDNYYTGTTTIQAGRLIVNGLIGPGEVSVENGILSGQGTLSGNVLVHSNGVISPGQEVGQMTLTSGLFLESGSVALFELNKTAGTSDIISGLGSVNYGGLLLVTNLAGTLALDDTFKLFDSLAYTGEFAGISLPVLLPGLAWDTTGLTNDGSITIVQSALPPQPPLTTNVAMVADQFVMSGSGGPTNGLFFVLASTNLSWPLSNWHTVATGQFDVNGNFNWTNPAAIAAPGQFFLLQLP